MYMVCPCRSPLIYGLYMAYTWVINHLLGGMHIQVCILSGSDPAPKNVKRHMFLSNDVTWLPALIPPQE